VFDNIHNGNTVNSEWKRRANARVSIAATSGRPEKLDDKGSSSIEITTNSFLLP